MTNSSKAGIGAALCALAGLIYLISKFAVSYYQSRDLKQSVKMTFGKCEEPKSQSTMTK